MIIVKNKSLDNLGFSIIEVIISVFIIGVMLVVYGRLNDTVSVNQEVEHQEVALRIARNQIEVLRAVPYNSLPATGAFTDPMLAQLPQGSAGVSNTAFNDGIKNITVTVSWTDISDSTSRSVSLATLISQGGL